jgi:hypothetical protein
MGRSVRPHDSLTDLIKEKGYQVEVIWECDWKKLVKAEGINTTRARLEPLKPLIPRDAYFGGRTNAVKLYARAEGEAKIFYIDITSQYPSVMTLPQYDYPIGVPHNSEALS